MSSVRWCLAKAIESACRATEHSRFAMKMTVEFVGPVCYDPTYVRIINNLQDAGGSVNPFKYEQGIVIGQLTDRRWIAELLPDFEDCTALSARPIV